MIRLSRITLFGPTPPPYGGVAVHVGRLYELLSDLGYSTRLLTFDGPRRPGSDLHVLRLDRLGLPAGLAKLAREVGYGGALHNHSPFTVYPSRTLELMLSLAKIWRIRWVETLHDQTIMARYEEFSPRQRDLFERAMLNAVRVIAMSDAIRDFLLNLGLPPNRVVVGEPLLPPRQGPASLPERYSTFMAGRSRVWLTVGAFLPLYDFETVALAFRRLLFDTPNAALIVISGRFAFDQAYEQRVRSILQTAQGHVMFLEDVSNADVQALMKAASLLIRGPRVESFGLSRIEAIFAGTPVVATATGATAYMTIYRYGDVDSLIHATQQAAPIRSEFLQEAASHYTEMASSSLQQILDVYADIGVRGARQGPL